MLAEDPLKIILANLPNSFELAEPAASQQKTLHVPCQSAITFHCPYLLKPSYL